MENEPQLPSVSMGEKSRGRGEAAMGCCERLLLLSRGHPRAARMGCPRLLQRAAALALVARISLFFSSWRC